MINKEPIKEPPNELLPPLTITKKPVVIITGGIESSFSFLVIAIIVAVMIVLSLVVK